MWQHFLRAEGGSQAKCKICKVVLSNSMSTTPLDIHLQKKHSIFVKGQINNSDEVTVTASGSKENSNEVQKKKKRLTDYFKSEDSSEDMISMLAALDGLSFFRICTSKTIRKLFNKSGYKLPESPHTIKKIVITRSNQLKAELTEELNLLKSSGIKFTITLDEWTSSQNVRYMNVNIHSPKLKRKSFRNLGLAKLIGKGTADNCLNILKRKIAEYNLSLDDDIICLASDGASVMCALGRKTNTFHQLCLAHGIQLAVIDVLYKKNKAIPEVSVIPDPESEDSDKTDTDTDETNTDQGSDNDDELDRAGFDVTIEYASTSTVSLALARSFKDVINKVRKAVIFFRPSPTRAETLYKYALEEGKKDLRLILDCKTRWSSLADMLARFLTLKVVVQKALIDYDNHITFSEEEMKRLEELSNTMNVIKATVEVLCEENANLIMTETALKFMIEKLGEIHNEVSRDLLVSLKQRIGERRLPELSGTLKYLDNSAKFYNEGMSSYPFENPHNIVIKNTIVKLNSYFESSSDSEDRSRSSPYVQTETESNDKNSMSMKDQLRRKLQNDAAESLQLRQSGDEVLDLGTKIQVEMGLFDGGGQRGTHLTRAYNLLLSIPPSSVEAERVFSSASYLCNRLRTKMNADTLDALSFLRSYYQSLN